MIYCGDDDKDGSHYSSGFGQSANSTVRFHVDMWQRTCSFSVDGRKYEEIFYDLPQEVYPFVVIMEPCNIRIRLVTDADHV